MSDSGSALIDISRSINIHLMGIGGAGMSGLALLLDAMGHRVSGCDMEETSYLGKLRDRGVRVEMKHHKEHLDIFSPELIIYTSAIAQDHPELIEARKKGIRVARRAEVLSIIFNGKHGVGVAGTHGKTTTSSMISLIAEMSGLNPTVAIGGELCDIGCNAKLGGSDYMVAELDESDGSFELFSPSLSVITNIDWDHIDHYATFDLVVEAFRRFIGGRKKDAPLIICAEDKGAMSVIEDGMITYGWGSGWRWGAADVIVRDGGGSSFTAYKDGYPIGEVSLRVPGEHNILNSLAALAASDLMGVSFDDARRALSKFSGAKRRQQFIGERRGVLIYDDYGHHPREIESTMAAMSGAFPNRRLQVIFQPHRYTRTQALYRDFAKALIPADRVFLLPIYSADEQPISGVSSFMIADELISSGRADAAVYADLQEAAEAVCDAVKQGDLVLTIGAGNIGELGKQILERMDSHAADAKNRA
ncbi:UDP-N-acetylmuramate--L-alanine ligase [Synergistales bacterium]|nr:UDP-N-acetylmuramate--L-alanine ligase [Synergistales bacterium]